MRPVAWIATGGLALLVGSGTALAQTIGYADAYDKIAAACKMDIKKLCSGVQLGNGGIQHCLEKNSAKVSASCKVATNDTFKLLEKRAAAQATARKVCDADVRKLCQGVVADDGHQLNCLLASTNLISNSCSQVIVDAGWH